MKVPRLLTALACAALFAAAASADDLTTIKRKINKEPAYTSKPKYCLLVFGPEAKTRVWLAQDGGTLYVDRNANGDLTEEGERVVSKKGDGIEPDEGVYSFEAGDIRDGSLTHKKLSVGVMKLDHVADREQQVKEYLAKNPQGRGYFLGLDVETLGFKGAGIGGRIEQLVGPLDVAGVLRFADKPEDAPIVHFGGPWHVTLYGRHRLTVGRQADLILAVGTPGVGPGTTAWIGYEGVIPEKVYPKAEISYPPAREGDAPVKELYELRDRC